MSRPKASIRKQMAARKKANEDGTPRTGELSKHHDISRKKADEDDTPRTEELPEYKPEKYGSLTDIDIDCEFAYA